MKRKFYLFITMVLGVLLTTIVHAIVEKWYIGKLLVNFDMWSLGLTWNNWIIIHHVFAIVLLLVGIWGGYRIGVHWWCIVYIERKRGMFCRVK